MEVLNLVAAIVIFLEAILGIIFSSLVIYIYFLESSGRTSFNLICLSRAINNVIVLLTHFLILDGPTALFSRNVWSPAVETLIMNPAVNVYMVNEFQTLLIAVNRFIAMFAPVWYHQLFSNKLTALFLACLYFARGYVCVGQVYDYFQRDCLLYLELADFGGHYVNDSCNRAMPTGFDGLFIIFWPLALFGVTVLLNLMTFTKILRFYLGRNMDSENLEPVKRNIKLFFQTVLQDSLFFVDILFTFQLSGLSPHRAWQFVCTVAVWGMVYMLDGFIMLMFSDRLSTLKERLGMGRGGSNRVSGA